MQLLAFIFMVIALRAVFDSHNYNRNAKTLELEPIPNMYSIHSWIGITVITLYCCQVIMRIDASGALRVKESKRRRGSPLTEGMKRRVHSPACFHL